MSSRLSAERTQWVSKAGPLDLVYEYYCVLAEIHAECGAAERLILCGSTEDDFWL